MRALLVLLGLAALVLLAAVLFGFVSFDQTRPAVVQAPQFEANVAKVNVGMENKTVAVPTISVDKPAASPSATPAQ